MNRRAWLTLGCSLIAALVAGGCQSPYHADRGALFGGLTGAGVGAIVGDAVGNAGAGAAIGAGVGTLTGAAIGESLDEIEARNRAQIAAQLGQQVRPGAVTLDDVVAMTKAGVSERLMITHIQHNGVAKPLTTDDVIYLSSQQVPDAVVSAMQAPPARTAQAPQPAGQPVIIKERYYGPPPVYYRPHYHYRHHRYRPQGNSWGFSFST